MRNPNAITETEFLEIMCELEVTSASAFDSLQTPCDKDCDYHFGDDGCMGQVFDCVHLVEVV